MEVAKMKLTDAKNKYQKSEIAYMDKFKQDCWI